MALADLATTTDLSSRGVTPTALHSVMLWVASSVIRGAAGSPIARTTSTVKLTAWGEQRLALPGLPVESVSSVSVDGSPVTGWDLVDAAHLWRPSGWGHEQRPAAVEVTLTHGLAEVPEDIKQLVCDLAILGADAAPAGAVDPRVFSETIDDYTVTFKQGSSVASAMELPTATKVALAARFGGGVAVVRNRA